MSFKVRNSIALGVLLLLVIGFGGYVSFFYQPGKIAKLQKEAKKIQGQLQDNTEQLRAITRMQQMLRETIHRWNNRTKEIAESDISSQTYGYLSDIIDESGFLRLNMALTGTKVSPQYSFNLYSLKGIGEFPNIFRFMWLLENGRKLYKIHSVVMRANELSKEDKEIPVVEVNFEMELHAYFTSEKSLTMPVMKPDSTPQPITSNPFWPTIFQRQPANVRNLLEVEKISVKAVAAEKALVMDQEGRLITLNVGDEVYLGKVSAFNPEEGVVEFTLNSGGILEVVRKRIEFEKDKKERGETR